jgi:phosphoribosylformylglycinamidine synthase subunit PurS
MKAQVNVMLKEGVLDPQGEAVNHALSALGYDSVKSVRQGKLIEIHLDENDLAAAERKVRDMCEKLLANTVIESYSIKISG